MKNKQLCSSKTSLKKYHTYGIEATCRHLILAYSEEEIKEAFIFSKQQQLPYLFLGRGSNVLFRDDYYDGVVIVNKMTEVEIDGTCVVADGGVNLPLLARKTSKMGLSGFETLVGIPGSIGGSICMNAGVPDVQISTYLTEVVIMYPDGKIKTLSKDECNFSYRSSVFIDSGVSILKARFNLVKKESALTDLHQHLLWRLKSQPISEKNSGCIFKNPSGNNPAGALIDKCGLKGKSVGGAAVSSMHANFINNTNNATFKDVIELIHEVQSIVKEKTGVDLEYEVRII